MAQREDVGPFRGRIKPLSCADILEFLRVLNRPGLLTCNSEGAAVGLYLRRDRIVHATSSRPADRLPDLLIAWGLITRAQCDDAMRRVVSGDRLARALLEAGGVQPRALMEARERQVRRIVSSLFEWETGEFAFLEDETPSDIEAEVDMPIEDVLREGIRSVRNLDLFRRRLPFEDWIFETGPGAADEEGLRLDPHERHVLRLVDGRRSIGDIGAVSEFGPQETRRSLFLLSITGVLRRKLQPSGRLEEEAPGEEIEAVLRRFNGMFGLVFQYMMREVGPISEHLLARSLEHLEDSHRPLFHRASLGGDGTIDAELVRDNLGTMTGGRRRETLIQGLNELLYAEMLVLRRTLGPVHEGRVLRALKEAGTRETGIDGV